MFAVVKTGGKQYKVSKDDKITVEKLEGDEGKSVDLDVLFTFDGKTAATDEKELGKASVTAKILEHKRADKITIFKKKRRQNYRRKKGHKQHQTVIQITDIKAA